MAPPARPVTPLGIIAATLQRVHARVAALEPGLGAELAVALELAAGLDPYLSRCTTPESPALAELARRTFARDWDHRSDAVVDLESEMLSGHVEGQTLRFLVALTGARRVLELGLFTGYSALAMAEALPPAGRLVACEVDPDVAGFARESLDAAPAGERVSIRVGPALDTLHQLADAGEAFDLVFVDADKAGYARYVTTIIDRGLLAAGGVVCVDNTLMQGEPYLPGEPGSNGSAIAAFNAAIAEDPRVEQVRLPLRAGLTLIRLRDER